MAADMSAEEQSNAMEAVKGRLIGMLEENKIDDAAVRRFCVARDFDVDATTQMLSNYIKWRKEYADGINAETPAIVKESLTKKAYFLGLDKEGKPLILIHGGGHDPNTSPVADVKQFAVFVLEAAIAAMPENVETFTVISDYSTFGYANMDNGLLSEGAELFMNYYPERLGNIYLTNYPFIMWGIWQVAKLLIDAKTQSKFIFVDNHEDLFEIADKSILPDFLSGDFVDHLPEDGSIGIDRLTAKKD